MPEIKKTASPRKADGWPGARNGASDTTGNAVSNGRGRASRAAHFTQGVKAVSTKYKDGLIKLADR